jgi:SAM-dependent methyltransferase
MTVPCIICAGSTSPFSTYRAVDRANDLEVALFGGKMVHRCEVCGHAFCAESLPDETLSAYYAALGGGREARRPSLGMRVARALALAVRDRVVSHEDPRAADQLNFEALTAWLQERRGSGLRVLEVGAGRANFSRALRTASAGSLTTDVVEPSRDFTVLYRLCRIHRVGSTLEQTSLEGAYDLIHASHVVEHLVDPQHAVSQMRRRLHPGGAAMVEVPNCEDPYWAYRYHPDPPHVQFFTPRSLRQLLEQQGFVGIDVRTCGRPLEVERDVGYLNPETPEYLTPDAIERLLTQRAARSARAGGTGSSRRDCADDGREFIRAVATVPSKAQ